MGRAGIKVEHAACDARSWPDSPGGTVPGFASR
jgi:hypothetical protein